MAVLTLQDGAHIAYAHTPGRTPGLVFLGGFVSDMTGTKALALESFAKEQGRSYVRFDYRGHGQSAGRFSDGTIGGWADDAIAVLDRVTEGPQVLIGSSMGAWIMLLVAMARPERIRALVGIASATDFTEDLIWSKLTPEIRTTLQRNGVYYQPSEYSEEPYTITLRLIQEARNHLLLRAPIPVRCPVRLIHGLNDSSVPWQRSLDLAGRLASEDVECTLVKNGDHRLSTPADLGRLRRIITELVEEATPEGLA